MPDRQVLEEYPLYRKCPVVQADTLDLLPKPSIHMACPICRSEQTFNMANEYWESAGYANAETPGSTVRCVYACEGCKDFRRYFFLHFLPDGSGFMKIGQFPPWEINPDSRLIRAIGDHSDYYKKGLVCESQGYGIGAFAYYRWIVEITIDNLLDQVPELMTGAELATYQTALAQTKNTIVAQEKIAIVKDLLPAILRPDGMNPLGVLHSQLSQGLHAESDDNCLSSAMAIREILVFLVNQLAISKNSAKAFTDNMRALLDKKIKK